MEGPSIVYRILGGPDGLTERDRFTGQTGFEVAAVVGLMLDERVRDTRHLGSNSSEGLALTVSIERIGLDVALVLLPEAVLAHAHCHGRGKPGSTPFNPK